MARFVAQRGFMKPLFWSLLNVHVHGKRNLAGMSGPYIAVANHSSHLDGPLVMSALPPRLTRYLATGAAADYFFTSPTKALAPVMFMNAFPVERGGSRSKHRGLSGNLLTEGVPILLFPEGTRSRTGAMAAFKPGPAALCISRNVPAIPIALVGAHLAMPTDSALPKSGRPDVHIVLGKPMWAEKGETARKFADRMHDQVLRMHDSMALATGFPTNADYAAEAERKKVEKAAAEQAALEDSKHAGADRPTARDRERKDNQ
ncbi:lysophospholipid acyltransferase family protein [Raineyella sp.]|uniref:Phospholipid/glycerol acyltransferase domain-containing protein n=1 Tax=bioreactor metagenome TaxID=1076179 RepID=A0A645E5E4_9ZZZZ|nr:lysophospholipid acyltransferase family protein [Raineyella sp.]MEA5153205.1 lysophospholipid acyltransferase family protein [Raineyella sp.]